VDLAELRGEGQGSPSYPYAFPRKPPRRSWFGFIDSALLVVILWRQFDHIAHARDAVQHRVPARAGTAG